MISQSLRHLPDITIITPVFNPEAKADGSKEIIFFTASRGHHADIGGILPGSMPPTSTNLREEGAEIVSFKVVDNGIFDKEGLEQRMVEEPAKWAGSSGCRNIRDVESDLKAVRDDSYPLFPRCSSCPSSASCGKPQGRGSHPRDHRRLRPRDCPGIHVSHPQERRYERVPIRPIRTAHLTYTENSVRTLLKTVAGKTGSNVLEAVDYLDDGSPIRLRVEIDKETGSAVFDFTGTGNEVRGNLNAPISVVHSAVIYCMRAMLDLDIPLNAGCLVPITSASAPIYQEPLVLTRPQSRFRRSRSSRRPGRRRCARGTYSRPNGSSTSSSSLSTPALRAKGARIT
jgi:5-oxoprolinase (ATP-hydrolysing)